MEMSLFSDEQIMKAFLNNLKRKANIELAKKLLFKKTFSAGEIAELTELTVDEVNALAAIIETIRICRDKNILKEFFDEREAEVIDEEMGLYSNEQIIKAYTKDIESRVAEETAQKEAREFAKRLLKLEDMSVEKIAEITKLPVDEVHTTTKKTENSE